MNWLVELKFKWDVTKASRVEFQVVGTVWNFHEVSIAVEEVTELVSCFTHQAVQFQILYKKMDEFEEFDFVLDENVRIDTDPREHSVHVHAALLLTCLLVQVDLNIWEVVFQVSEFRIVESILLKTQPSILAANLS